MRKWRQSLQPPMTQRELAAAISVSDGFMAHVETGRTLPGVRTLVALGRALGVPLPEMLRASGYVQPVAEAADDRLFLEPELRLFFRDDWPKLTDDERELLRDFARMLKTRLRRRRST